MSKNTYHIMYNPLANRTKAGGAAEALARLTACLDEAGQSYVVHKSNAQGQITQFVRALQMPCYIVIVGGDGTIFEAINGLEAGNSATIGIIPAGTGNDIARMLSIPKDIDAAVKILLQGRTINADAALINGRLKSALFASYGIAADIVLGMAELRKKTAFSYFTTLLRRVIGYKPKSITIRLNGDESTYNADFLSAHNCICAGGGMHLAHNAKMDDGKLDLVIVEYKGFGRRIANIISILTKKLYKQPNFKTIPFEGIEIISPNEYQCVIDGEIMEYGRLEIQVLPRFVKIIC